MRELPRNSSDVHKSYLEVQSDIFFNEKVVAGGATTLVAVVIVVASVLVVVTLHLSSSGHKVHQEALKVTTYF